MDKKQIAIKLTIDTLGLSFNIDSFPKRLILQKAIYLAQAIGVNFGYHYRWYLKGPYCNSLADDGFAVASQIDNKDEYKGWTLDKVAVSALEKIKPIVSEKKGGIEKLAKDLELLASVHFLIVRGQVSEDNILGIVKILQDNNKIFNAQEVQEALAKLRRYDLIGQKQNNS
jgi:uncharacterized protein YwgA